jgi:hypothetical protein
MYDYWFFISSSSVIVILNTIVLNVDIYDQM